MLKDFLKYTSLDPRLVRAVVRQSGGWGPFKEKAPDIDNHGAQAGYGGWIYYSETCEFFKRNRKLILDLAERLAGEFDQGMLEMMEEFSSFKKPGITVDDIARAIYQGKGDHVTEIQNVLAWFTLEEVARYYVRWRDY